MNQRRERFTLYRRSQTLVDGEEQTETSEVKKLWGKRRTLNASEARISPDRPEEHLGERFYFSPFEDIQFRDLLYDGESAYRVQAIGRRKSTKEHLEVDCIYDIGATEDIGGL